MILKSVFNPRAYDHQKSDEGDYDTASFVNIDGGNPPRDPPYLPSVQPQGRSPSTSTSTVTVRLRVLQIWPEIAKLSKETSQRLIATWKRSEPARTCGVVDVTFAKVSTDQPPLLDRDGQPVPELVFQITPPVCLIAKSTMYVPVTHFLTFVIREGFRDFSQQAELLRRIDDSAFMAETWNHPSWGVTSGPVHECRLRDVRFHVRDKIFAVPGSVLCRILPPDLYERLPRIEIAGWPTNEVPLCDRRHAGRLSAMSDHGPICFQSACINETSGTSDRVTTIEFTVDDEVAGPFTAASMTLTPYMGGKPIRLSQVQYTVCLDPATQTFRVGLLLPEITKITHSGVQDWQMTFRSATDSFLTDRRKTRAWLGKVVDHGWVRPYLLEFIVCCDSHGVPAGEARYVF